jgi:hypothetical protein
MQILETVDEELSSASKISSMRSISHQDNYHQPRSVSIYGGTNHTQLDLKARLMELELEKEEN